MTKDEILDFYEDNWEEHNTVFIMLSEELSRFETEIAYYKSKLLQNSDNDENMKEILHLKKLLQQCEDSLDEERHKIETK
ncbi:MAG: hypothetical protein U9N52_03260 [Campylobacterota bacterium]|nr:hypothetical protein [Campylobacterota bacterium]